MDSINFIKGYPDSCFSSITSSCSSPQKFIDPEAIFKLSLQVAIAELSNFKNTMISNSNQEAAFADCQSQIKGAVSRLNDSVVAMEVRDRGERVRDERQNIGERVRLNIIIFLQYLLQCNSMFRIALQQYCKKICNIAVQHSPMQMVLRFQIPNFPSIWHQHSPMLIL